MRWARKLINLQRKRFAELLKLIFSNEIIRRVRLWMIVRKLGYLQKFWIDGKPEIPASPLEASFFKKLGIESKIFNCMDDYRCAGLLPVGETIIPIENLDSNEDVQFAIAIPNFCNEELEIILDLGNQRRVIRDLGRNRWHDLRIRSGHTVSVIENLRILNDVPIFITMPRVIKRFRPETFHSQPQHVLICVLDSWSSHFLSEPHPFKEGTSVIPNIQRFFKNGFQALEGFSNAEWTLPVISSLFTGMYPSRHKTLHPREWVELDRNRHTLPEYFQQNGYHTLFGSSAPRLSPAFGMLRGFDRFIYHFPDLSSEFYSPAKWINEILGHIESHSSSKTFSYFHFPDIHPVWIIPDETRYFNLGRIGCTSFNIKKMFDGKMACYDLPAQAKNLYLLRMAELDRILGMLFDYVERELGDNALVVVTSDHGLKMPYISEEHVPDEPFMTDIRVQIPLFMRGAGIRPQVYTGMCQPNIDIPKTFLELVGIEPDDLEFNGINLLKPHEQRISVISESFFKNIYEIAIRGFGHVLILKFPADDIECRITDLEPFYHALFKKMTTSYSLEYDYKEKEPEIHARLHTIALNHINQIGLARGLGKIGHNNNILECS